MTATARKPKVAWRKEEADEDATEPDDEREASRLLWSVLEQEVKQELKKTRRAGDGDLAPTLRRGAEEVGYEDVAGEGPGAAEAEEAARLRIKAEATKAAAEAAASLGPGVQGPAPAPRASADSNAEADLPQGVITAGRAGEREEKKRGGVKQTGAMKRKKKADEDGGKKKKRREDEDPDRWVKLKLKGEDKEKRVDATRVVHYHDFDTLGLSGSAASGAASLPVVGGSAASGAASSAPVEAAAAGNFRAALRKDLWDDDSD